MHDWAALTNRIRKTLKTRRKWAARVPTDAYRAYEMDIPELRYYVDIYGEHAVVYDKRSTKHDAPDDPAHDDALVRAVAAGIERPVEQVHLKRRRRMPGAAQYEKLAQQGVKFTVREETSKYLVNLSDYLDTGLFLDHRPLRHEFRALPPGTRFLNLFCYTGSVSVAAAHAGARTTSVDMSNTYLEWAEENFKLNGFALKDHALIRADAREFLAEGPSPGEKYDVVFLDPPTFSNSKRMDGTWDVQRDHRPLVNQAMRFVAPEGVLYFSTNRQVFTLDPALSEAYQAEDITERTIPEDFRNKHAHRCFALRPRK